MELKKYATRLCACKRRVTSWACTGVESNPLYIVIMNSSAEYMRLWVQVVSINIIVIAYIYHAYHAYKIF